PIDQLQKRIADFRKNHKHPKKPNALFRKIFFIAAVFLVAFLLIGTIGFIALAAWVAKDLPDPDKLMDRTIPLSTKIYDRTGEVLLYEIHGDERRTLINLEEIPDYVKKATVAAEDRDFYKHKGVSIVGIIRSLVRNVLTGSKVGGSTITQQFVKNAVLTSEKTYVRKIKEIILAWQIESRFSKDQILKLYLNEIPYGKTAYGIEAAARVYFNKSAKDLTLAETATIVGMVQAPTAIWNNKDRLTARKEYVLDSMVKESYITAEEEKEAREEKMVFNTRFEAITAPHFVEYVQQILTERYGEKVVEQGGLKVITTLDANKQKIGEQVVKEGVEKNEKKYNATNAALVAIDAKTGDILTMVGSRDYFDDAHDGKVNVATRLNQPGSSLKPLIYATSFAKGLTPDTILFDTETKFKTATKDYAPRNYDGKERGPVTIRKALAGSLNIPAVKALYIAGVDNVLRVAKDFGYTTFDDQKGIGLAMVLGGADVTLLEHTSAFATFAREGIRHPARAILRIEDSKGKLLEETKVEEIPVMDTEVVRQLTDILTDNNSRSYIFGSKSPLILPDRIVAAKTGTTNEWRDGWTLGYTPSVAVGVWAGKNDNTKLKAGADGVFVAAPLWNEFMRKILEGTPVETFKKPKTVKTTKPILNGKFEVEQEVKIDRVTQKIIPAECVDQYPKEFVATKKIKSVHDTLFWINKDDPRGPEPKDPKKDPQFVRWEEAAQSWAKKNNYLTPDLPKEQCGLRDKSNLPAVTVTSPQPNETVTSDSVLVSSTVSSPRSIARVEYFLDGQLIGQTTTAPHQFSIPLTGAANGFHDASVRATDDIGGFTDQAITLNVITNSPTSITINLPAPAVQLAAADFPYTISATVADADGVASVSGQLLSSSNTPATIGELVSPSSIDVSFNIDSPPSAGEYRFFILARDNKGASAQSDFISITVQ
ncbi:MAG TPA: PBP1A family penicillin-binding protein, partial [Patescibacteria group bacterium]|nr:PBP1A family penicillin-binding protein [Patescibacteria group bacterium]